ncbi:hypothetical protein EJ08DRAFT_291431 [Tothia fuscella]|uniref:Uncharacterized protein n=1 Tax=Tothia fuscella TaxID=1048955 RepID=A0A9P4P1S8_9PEZI|nr:hypothetical protein EJ08DRAFT_291431 [Tothia fuscella]
MSTRYRWTDYGDVLTARRANTAPTAHARHSVFRLGEHFNVFVEEDIERYSGRRYVYGDEAALRAKAHLIYLTSLWTERSSPRKIELSLRRKARMIFPPPLYDRDPENRHPNYTLRWLLTPLLELDPVINLQMELFAVRISTLPDKGRETIDAIHHGQQAFEEENLVIEKELSELRKERLKLVRSIPKKVNDAAKMAHHLVHLNELECLTRRISEDLYWAKLIRLEAQSDEMWKQQWTPLFGKMNLYTTVRKSQDSSSKPLQLELRTPFLSTLKSLDEKKWKEYEAKRDTISSLLQSVLQIQMRATREDLVDLITMRKECKDTERIEASMSEDEASSSEDEGPSSEDEGPSSEDEGSLVEDEATSSEDEEPRAKRRRLQKG